MIPTLDYESPQTARSQRGLRRLLRASTAASVAVFPAMYATAMLSRRALILGMSDRDAWTFASLFVGAPLVFVIGVVGCFAVTGCRQRDRLALAFAVVWWIDVFAVLVTAITSLAKSR